VRQGCEISVLLKPFSAHHIGDRLRYRSRKSGFVEASLRLLLLIIFSAAATLGQRQSPPPAQPPPELQSQQKEESLGDVARIARARRGKSKPSKVFTEDDLSMLPSNGVSVVGQDAPAATTSRPAKDLRVVSEGNETAKSGRHDEQYWLRRFGDLQDQMTAVDLRIKQVKDDIAAFQSDARKGTSIPEAYFPLPELTEEKENLQKQIELLREEGRKEGADPGWLR
jgi:hypothetical protein